MSVSNQIQDICSTVARAHFKQFLHSQQAVRCHSCHYLHHDTFTHNDTCSTVSNRAYTVTQPYHRRSVFPLPLFPESRCLGRNVGICLSASPLRAILPRLKVALSDNLIALFCCNASLRPLPVAVLRARPRDMDLRRTQVIWSNC